MTPEERLYDDKRKKALARRMVQMSEYLRRCVGADALSITANDDGTITVRATWPGGNYKRVYELRDLYRTCRTRREVIGDILRARGLGGKPSVK